MLGMEKDTSSIPLDRLSGLKTLLMTDLSILVENKRSALLMATPCPWCADMALCNFLSLESLQMSILRGPHLHTSQDPKNGKLKSWPFLIHLVMGSLLGPMIPLRDLLVTLALINLGLHP